MIDLNSILPLKAGPSLVIITNPDSQQLLVRAKSYTWYSIAAKRRAGPWCP